MRSVADTLCAALMLSVGLGLSGCPRTDEVPSDSSRGEPSAPSASASTRAARSESSVFEPVKVEHEFKAMGTHVTFVTHTTEKLDRARLQGAFDAAAKEIERLEALMSSWRAESDVSRVNRAGGEYVEVSPETFEVLEKSLWAGEISKGSFDVTFQSLSLVWKFGDAADEKPRPPTRAEVEPLRRLVDYRKVELDEKGRRVRIGKDQKLGLGGIAKGYIVDRTVAVLKKHGLSSFLVRAGGDLYGAGVKPGGDPWVSGIQDPRGQAGSYFALIKLENHAFSTAGDYARAYEYQGKRYHHIIDPKTGFPATRSRSVTVWAPSALLADAVDDAVFILGPEEGLKLVESLQDVGAVIVDANNRVWISERLRNQVELLSDPTN